MKTHNPEKARHGGMALIAALLLLPSMSLRADIVTVVSSNFSLGFGYTSAATWNTSETSSTNTPTTQGDFQFLVSASSPFLTTHGPTFTNRVLGDGGISGYSTYVDTGTQFLSTVTANWNGTFPTNFIPGTATLQTSLTALKIWASGYNDPGLFRFNETTPGHTNSSAFMIPGTASLSIPNFGFASNYVQMVWDPSDYSVSGTNQTRTFSTTVADNLSNPASYILTALDGYEVLGNVTLTYEIIPEPSAVLLLGMGSAILTLSRRRL